MIARRARAVAQLATLSVLASCTPRPESYPLIDVDTDARLVYVAGERQLVAHDFGSGEEQALHISPKTIVGTSITKDGSRIALFNLGTDRRPFSSRRVKLDIVEPRPSGSLSAASSVALPQFDDDALRVLDFVPPLWGPDDRSVLVAHPRGIDRVTLDGAISPLAQARRVTALAQSPDGNVIAFANDENFFFVDREGRTIEGMTLDLEITSTLGYRYVRAIDFSPSGDRMAVAHGSRVHVVDVASMSRTEIADVKNTVFWLRWTPQGDRLILVSGRSMRRSPSSGVSDWSSTVEGSYRVFRVNADGSGLQKLLDQNLIDAREARPALSPDGRFVAASYNAGGRTGIFVIATDGSGVELIAPGVSIAFAGWQP